jgi:hypothetical protein
MLHDCASSAAAEKAILFIFYLLTPSELKLKEDDARGPNPVLPEADQVQQTPMEPPRKEAQDPAGLLEFEKGPLTGP